jgi:D-methionine transport system substrate-binding protein
MRFLNFSINILSFLGLTLLTLFTLVTVQSCGQKQRGPNEIYIGTIAGPESDLVKTAQGVAKQKYNLTIKIIEFEDYNTPNTALSEGSIDANMFQHQHYLDYVISHKKYAIQSIGKTFIYPMGGYSKKYSTIGQLPDKALIAIPNDPSNGERALKLLADSNLITLSVPEKQQPTSLKNITSNPKQFVFKELDAAQLPRALEDVDLAIINTNYAIPAGLKPKRDALIIESSKSPYANIVAVRSAEIDEPKYQQLMSALNSTEVLEKANQLFDGQVIPAWK